MLPISQIIHAKEKLLNLLNSWDETAHQFPLCENNLFAKLLLKQEQGELVICKKIPRTLSQFLPDLLLGKPIYENFQANVRKIKQLFAATMQLQLTDDEKIRLGILQENINALGRHVLARKCELLPPIFRSHINPNDFQIRYIDPILAPKNFAIVAKLFNRSNSLCWLNALLKYISCSSLYDDLLKTPSSDITLEEVRKQLVRTVNSLRLRYPEQIINQEQQALLETFKTSPFKNFVDGQQDADEFLTLLQAHYSSFSSEEKQIHNIKLYEHSNADIIKPGTVQECRNRLQLSLMNNSSDCIDFQRCLETKEILELEEYYVSKEGHIESVTEKKEQFLVREACVYLPEKLEIFINRGHTYLGQEFGQTTNAPLKIAQDGTIVLIEEKPIFTTINEEQLIKNAKPHFLCVYQATCGIIRSGWTSGSGHFTAIERTSSGSLTLHNDDMVSTKVPESTWKQASIIEFTLVKKIPIKETIVSKKQ